MRSTCPARTSGRPGAPRLRLAVCLRRTLAFLVIALALIGGPDAAGAVCDLERGPARTIARVLDGETLALDDGSEVRLLGIAAPRALDSGAETGLWPPEESARKALEDIVRGKSVRLAFAGPRTDRYGRLLAHMFVVEAMAGTDKPTADIWLQGLLLSGGLVRAVALPGHRDCTAELLTQEASARTASAGLWASAAYQVREAGDTRTLAAMAGTLQVVEGTVTRVGEGRTHIYVSLGADRRGFQAVLRRNDRDLLGLFGGDADTLSGKTIRARGWVELQRGAPVIDLSSGGLIEIVGEAAQVGEPRAPRARKRSSKPAE